MIKIVKGDLFNQNVECYVNSWNMNYLPWFILWPHGVSGRLKKVAGFKPFNELLLKGILKPGTAVLTSGGKISQSIIHVSSLTWYWTSSLKIVEECTINSLLIAERHNFKSIAIPLIGAGVGGLKSQDVINTMLKACTKKDTNMEIFIVKYK